MTSSVRYTTIINSTGAVLTPATGLQIDGKDVCGKIFKRIFAAIDVGTDAGKTRDNTDPTGGCLVLSVTGAKITGVPSIQLFRPTAATNQTFDQVCYATDAHYFGFGTRISPDGMSLYILDVGDDNTTQIAANDYIMLTITTGNY